MTKNLVLLASLFTVFSAWAQAPAEVTLTRLDCGNGFNDQRRFSDSFAYANPKVPFTFSCYVIKHGSDYMVWDTGYLPGSTENATNKPIAELLGQINIKPDQVKFVGISHFHADHTGQLAPFANATLLIGKGDWDGINANPPMGGANVVGFKEWMGTSRKVKPLTADEDVFGDGSVIVFRTPGHTPGHTSVLVRLKEKGPVVLLGDAAHFHENYESNGVPGFNFDRAQTVASLERIKAIEKNLKATVIIQHDPRDIDKLPAFPNAAR
jgi:N-acyl homoserine lactone hydrolase